MTMTYKSKILLVDDTESNIDILKEILGREYNLSIATSGELALQIVNKVNPDLILLDILMPEMDGYEVCRRLKSNEKTANIPVIFVTIKSDIEDEQRGLDLGAIDYIRKPFSPPVVLARVRNHILLKHQRDQLEKSISLLEHEKELLQQKADLGILAGSYAHDMANILCASAIFNMIPQAVPSPEEWEGLQEDLMYAGESIELGLEISYGFLNYLRDIGEEATLHTLNDFVSTLNIYSRQYRGRLIKNIKDDLPEVLCKGYQIRRVIINLFMNAMQVLEKHRDPEIVFSLWGDEEYAYLSIKDNGPGIPSDIEEHIFEELFTTKERGTGIGLYLVKQIIDCHEGKIELETSDKDGTTFTIMLPVAKKS